MFYSNLINSKILRRANFVSIRKESFLDFI